MEKGVTAALQASQSGRQANRSVCCSFFGLSLSWQLLTWTTARPGTRRSQDLGWFLRFGVRRSTELTWCLWCAAWVSASVLFTHFCCVIARSLLQQKLSLCKCPAVIPILQGWRMSVAVPLWQSSGKKLSTVPFWVNVTLSTANAAHRECPGAQRGGSEEPYVCVCHGRSHVETVGQDESRLWWLAWVLLCSHRGDGTEGIWWKEALFSFWYFWKVCYNLLFWLQSCFLWFHSCRWPQALLLVMVTGKIQRCPGQEGESDVILVSSEWFPYFHCSLCKSGLFHGTLAETV